MDDSQAQGRRAADRVDPGGDLRGAQIRLQRFSRRIDTNLRLRYASHRLRRLLAPMRHPRERGRPVRMWMPSTWLLVLAGLFMAVVLAAKYVPNMDVLLPDLPWWTVAVWMGLFLTVERVVIPQIAFARHRFRLMRLEYREDKKEYSDVYRVAHSGNTPTGFELVAWRPVRDVEPGDIVIAVVNALDEGVAIIPLRTQGRLPVMAFVRELFAQNAMPAMSTKVRVLAQQFDLACDQDAAMGDRLARMSAVRGEKTELRPDAQSARAWSSLVLEEPLRARLTGMAQDVIDGRATAPHGLLLHGPPGVGKTLIARTLAESMGCAFYPLSLTDLKSSHVGQSAANVRALWEKARSQPRAVIFVDECETIFGRRGAIGTDSFVEDIVSEFLAQWDGFAQSPQVWVVAATNRRELIDPALMSRFEEQLQVELPEGPGRRRILELALARYGYTGALPDEVEALTIGMAGRELNTLAKRLARAQPEGIDLAGLAAETESLRRQGSTVTAGDARWDTLILPETTLKDLKTTAGLLRHAEVFRQRGISVPRGMLLYGPPGTGKTQIARTLANETGLRFIAASTADIKQGFLGQSGQKVRELFERARESAPALLFIDEIDVIAATRGVQSDAIQTEIIGQLLQEMDGIVAQPQPVFVLAATNRVDQLDPALLSRLPKRIEVGLPDHDAIRRLLVVLLTGKPLDFDLEDAAADLAGRALGRSGRELRNWIEVAEHRAVTRAIERSEPTSVALRIEDFGER